MRKFRNFVILKNKKQSISDRVRTEKFAMFKMFSIDG